MGLRGELFSCKASTANGKRTYFLMLKKQTGDLFLNVVESKPHGGSGYERHSIVVFEEDMELFTKEMQKSLDFIRKNKER